MEKNNRYMKVIFIDSKNKKVIEVEIMNFGAIAAMIGCSRVEHVYYDDNNEIYVDEEGLFDSDNDYIFMKDWGHPLAGSGVIIGYDPEKGTNNSHTLNLADIKENVVFMSKSEVRNWTLLNK